MFVCLSESHVNVQMDDHMGVIDFNPSTDVGVIYLTEADLVGGDPYKAKILKLAKVLIIYAVMVVMQFLCETLSFSGTVVQCQYDHRLAMKIWLQ